MNKGFTCILSSMPHNTDSWFNSICYKTERTANYFLCTLTIWVLHYNLIKELKLSVLILLIWQGW